MAKKKQPVYVSCRYPKCTQLHDSNKVLKSEAFNNGKGRYYHADCYHTMQTVNQIRDLFYNNIDPTMTGKEIGQLVSTVNYMIFQKSVDVDYLKFALEYFINNKPDKLHHPPGLHYIIKDNDVIKAWEQRQESKIRAEMKGQMEKVAETIQNDFDLESHQDRKSNYNNNGRKRFSKILGT